MNRLWVAIAMLTFLAVAAWSTLGEGKIRIATIIVLGFFAVRIFVAHSRKVAEERTK